MVAINDIGVMEYLLFGFGKVCRHRGIISFLNMNAAVFFYSAKG